MTCHTCTWPDFDASPFPSLLHFPVCLHPTALSLTFLRFFGTSQCCKRSLRQTLMAETYGWHKEHETYVVSRVDMVPHFSPLSSAICHFVPSLCATSDVPVPHPLVITKSKNPLWGNTDLMWRGFFFCGVNSDTVTLYVHEEENCCLINLLRSCCKAKLMTWFTTDDECSIQEICIVCFRLLLPPAKMPTIARWTEWHSVTAHVTQITNPQIFPTYTYYSGEQIPLPG